MPEAIKTFALNHPGVRAECKPIEEVNACELRTQLNLLSGELDVLVGGPPCQGFSINAPSRFLADPRNSMFKHYARFVEEFEPKTIMFENVPGLLSMGDGAVFRQILQVFGTLGYELSVKILYGPHYGIPQERWRLILLGSRLGQLEHPSPTHFAKGRANFRGGASLTFPALSLDRERLSPAVTVGDAIRDLPRLEMGEGAEEVGYTHDATSTYALRLRNPEGITFNHHAAKLSKQNIEQNVTRIGGPCFCLTKTVRSPFAKRRDFNRFLIPIDSPGLGFHNTFKLETPFQCKWPRQLPIQFARIWLRTTQPMPRFWRMP